MKPDLKPESAPSDDLTEAGYKPVTVWIPDVSDPEFIASYKQQRAAIADASESRNEIEWWERTQTHEGWV